MFTRLRVENYKLFKEIDVSLGRFAVLVGPNSSGKSTFIDVFRFLRDAAVRVEPEARLGNLTLAVKSRVSNFHELTFQGRGGDVTLEFHANIKLEETKRHRKVAYLLRFGLRKGEINVVKEKFKRTRKLLMDRGVNTASFFLEDPIFADTSSLSPLLGKTRNDQTMLQMGVLAVGNYAKTLVAFYSFLYGDLYFMNFALPDEPLKRGVSPPEAPSEHLLPDGSNLPNVIKFLKEKHPHDFQEWLEVLRDALGDVRDIEVIEREEDRHLYIKVYYDNSGKFGVPSWSLSDGTLRFMALSIIPFAHPRGGVFFIEEPENGLHPRALEVLLDVLESFYAGQVFLATHSPILIGLIEDIEEVLCFSRNPDGSAKVIPGPEHPVLKEWRKGVSLGHLFASGILG